VSTELTFEILAQPDDETCGPTCLHAVYRYLGDFLPLEQVIDEIPLLRTGGTLAPLLGLHALRRGHPVTIYTYNLEIFDPTWFGDGGSEVSRRLMEQADLRPSLPLVTATEAYLDFLAEGGEVRFEELTPDLIRGPLARGVPIMTGLSATYLYQSARERFDGRRAFDDPLRGSPTGHFVVLHGHDPTTDSVLVADPLHENPFETGPSYRVGMIRLLGAILLGVLTYDGNLLVVEPKQEAQ
jgi:hypothetical protein